MLKNFGSLIRERREEKHEFLRQKLNENLQIISDRNKGISGVNAQPFPEGAFERLKASQVWDNVLDYLSDTVDTKNASLTCATFSGIQEKPRILKMLPKVLDILQTKADDALEKRNYHEECVWGEYYEKICLQSRGVCKAWKNIADFHLFESPFIKDDWFLKITDLENYRAKICNFKKETSIDRVMSMSIFEISPYLFRTIHVNMKTSEVVFRKLMELLQAHGKSVWFLEFICDRDLNPNISVAEAYERLCDLLKLMPNLKGLALAFIPRGLRQRQNSPWQMLQDVQLGFDHERPEVPVLNSLEHLYSESVIDTSILSEIIRKCVNLRSVNCHRPQEITDERIEALVPQNLERYEDFHTIITSNLMNNAFVWPLKHLSIHLTFVGPNTRERTGQDGVEMASVMFPALNRFAGTLEHLRIFGAIKMDYAVKSEEAVSLNLPLLKSFVISKIYSGTMGFDQLLPLKTLEEISVEKFDEDGKANVNVLIFYKRREIEKSYVWNCFPNLKRLKLDRRGCWIDRPEAPLIELGRVSFFDEELSVFQGLMAALQKNH